MAYEPTVADIYPLILAFPVDDLAPPFCFSTIFRHDVELNTTNEFDTITSIGYRMPPDQQDLTVPFKVEAGPAVRVTYFDATAEFPYVTRLGPESFTYLTVCITGSGPLPFQPMRKAVKSILTHCLLCRLMQTQILQSLLKVRLCTWEKSKLPLM